MGRKKLGLLDCQFSNADFLYWSSIFQKKLEHPLKNLGGYFGAPKMDFYDSKGKNECTLMDILSFWG